MAINPQEIATCDDGEKQEERPAVFWLNALEKSHLDLPSLIAPGPATWRNCLVIAF